MPRTSVTEAGQLSRRGAVGAAVLTGLLYIAAFPPFDQGLAGFVALVPLFLALRGRARGEAFLLGWLAGTIGICGLVSGSIYVAATQYFGDGSATLALFALFVPQLHGALYFAVFAALVCGWERRAPFSALLLLPAAWTACELGRSLIGYGAPWILLGHSQHAHLPLIQIADLGGVFAVSFAVALGNAAIAIVAAGRVDGGLIRRGGREAFVVTAITTAVLLAILRYGDVQMGHWQSTGEGARLAVALVQPNLPLRARSSMAAAVNSLTRLVDLTRSLVAPADLVIWPENAVGFSLAANPSMLAGATESLPQGGRLLLGAPREIATPEGVLFRNSAFLLDRGGRIVESYDKLRLTPFAETSPLSALPWLRRRFASRDVYTPGERQQLFDAKGSPFAVLICFEIIYADLALDAVRAGARFLVNISNDDWFGGAPALEQHFDAALFRAVETRRFLLRATNSGITAVVDPRGAVIAEARRDEATTLAAEVAAIEYMTPYARWGDVFAWVCVAITFVQGILTRRRGELRASA